MKKTRLLAFLLSVMMLLTSMPLLTFSVAADSQATPVCEISGASVASLNTTYTSIGAAFDAINATPAGTNCGVLKLLANCMMSRSSNSTSNEAKKGTVIFGTDGSDDGGKMLVLDLNGYVLQGVDTDRGMICVTLGTILTVKDSRFDVPHHYNLDNGLYVWNSTETSGTVFYGGAMTGGKNLKDYGSAIQIRGGVVNVEGGNFLGNTAQEGAICLRTSDSLMNISGGTFAGNVELDSYKGLENICYAAFDLIKTNNASMITGGCFDKDFYSTMKTQFFASRKGVEFVKEGDWYIVKSTTSPEFTTETDDVIAFRGIQRSKNESGNYSIRFVAEILASKVEGGNTYAGFDITVNGDKKKRLPVSKYYTKLLANIEQGISEDIVPTSGYVLIALVLENIDLDNVDICAQPYYMEMNVDEQEMFADAADIRIADEKPYAVKLTNCYMPYRTYYTNADGSAATEDNHTYAYKFFSIGNDITLRAYFGQYTWLGDKSGFICGKENGSFYFYDVNNQKLVYLDDSHIGYIGGSGQVGSLDVYLNPEPINGNYYAFYKKKDAEGYLQIWRVNAKDPADRKMLFSQKNAKLPIDPNNHQTIDIANYIGGNASNFDKKKISMGLEVTYDGKYTYYKYYHGSDTYSPDYSHILGRINFETGELEYAQIVHVAESDGNGGYIENSNHLNHIIINPVYPDYILLNHPDAEGMTKETRTRLHMVNLQAGTEVTYTARYQFGYDEAVEADMLDKWDIEGIYHMIWSYDGKYIITHGGQWYGGALILDKDKVGLYNTADGNYEEPQTRPVPYGTSNHWMADKSLTWGVGDGAMGTSNPYRVSIFNLYDIKDYGEDGMTTSNYYGKGDFEVYDNAGENSFAAENLYVIRKGIDTDMLRLGLIDSVGAIDHPYHAHPEITADGTLISWGDINLETGTLGIAWFDMSAIKNSAN